MNLSLFLRCLRQQWWIVVLTTVVGLALGVLAAQVLPKSYESQAQVFVNVANPQSVTDLQMGEQFAMARAASYAQLATTNSVLRPVVDQLGLRESPEALAASTVTATNQPNTAMITITATDPQAQGAARMAQATAESLVREAASLETGEHDPRQAGVQLTVVQRAAAPESPAAPSRTLNAALGAVVGLIVGLLLVLWRGDRTDRRRGRSGGSHER